MFIYVDLYLYECVVETMSFTKLYASVDNGSLHVNIHKLHFLANRTRRGWKQPEKVNVVDQQPVQFHGD